MKKQAAAVEIVISGDKGAGKSLVLSIVAEAFKAKGVHADCYDDDGRVSVDPSLVNWPLDDRLVMVTTSENSMGMIECQRKALQRMLKRLCSKDERTSEQVVKDWDDARALLAAID